MSYISIEDASKILDVVKGMSSSTGNLTVNVGCSFVNQTAAEGDVAFTGEGNIHQRNVYERRWEEIKGLTDLSIAAKQLCVARMELKRDKDTSYEKELAICAIAAAEKSAKENNGPGVLKHLGKLKSIF